MTTTLAYGLTRTRDVPGSRLALLLVLGTLLFSAGVIPNYLLVKSLHLLNTYWAVILPGTVSAFNLVVIRQFFGRWDTEEPMRLRIERVGATGAPRPAMAVVLMIV